MLSQIFSNYLNRGRNLAILTEDSPTLYSLISSRLTLLTKCVFMKNLSNVIWICLFCLVATGLFQSCSKQEEIINTENATLDIVIPNLDGISEKDGRIVFKDEATFARIVDATAAFNLDDNYLEAAFPNFISYQTVFDALPDAAFDEYDESNGEKHGHLIMFLEKNGVLHTEATIDDVIPAFLANEDGIIQIGDHIFHFSYEEVLKLKVDQYFAVAQSKKKLDKTNLAYVERFPITRTSYNLDLNELQERDVRIALCEEEYCCVGNGRKLDGEIYKVDAGFYKSAGAKTKHYRKMSGKWRSERAPKLHIQGSIDVSTSGCDNNSNNLYFPNCSVNDTRNNANSVKEVGWSKTFTGCSVSIPSYDVYHKCDDCDDGNSHGCWNTF